MFGASLSTKDLINLCRVLRHSLGAGLTLRQTFRQQASGRASPAVRRLAERVLEDIEAGQSLSVALERHKNQLSPLFLAMVHVGDQTGHLPEIFAALEQHYLLEQKLKRQLLRQSLGTIIQFVIALLLIAFLIFILGMIAQSTNATPMSIFGLQGTSGALTFLGISFGGIGLLWFCFRLFLRSRQAAAVQRFLLRLPALGPALYSLVMSRFTMALQLTLDSGLSIVKALRLSLQATGNAWFVSRGEPITTALKNGVPLTDALGRSSLFEDEFLHIVAAAEEGGRVPEMMEHQAQYWHEEAARRLTTLTRLATLGVWLIYAGFMIYAIFQIAGQYLGALGV